MERSDFYVSSPSFGAVTNGDEQMAQDQNHVSLSAAAGDVELPADSEQQDQQSQQHQLSPAKGRGRGRGRGNAKGRIKGARTAQQKPAPKMGMTGRGRRQKLYDSLKVQAAYERMQELKANFTTVAKMVKPALQELADRTISKLSREREGLPNEPETAVIQDFLDQRLAETQEAAHAEKEAGFEMATRVEVGNYRSVNAGCNTQVAELCHERYGTNLRQLEILEYLYDNNLPCNLAPGEFNDYIDKPISQDAADHPGPHEVVENGICIPFPNVPVTALLKCKPFEEEADTEVRPKRKAQGQPEGQPASKASATSKGEDGDVPDLPARHIGGLLSAVEEFGAGVDSPSASNAPSPAAVPDDIPDVPSPRNSQRRGVATRTAKSRSKTPQQSEEDVEEEPSLPKGVSAPDEFGVRVVTRRGNAANGANNRILYPALFDFESHEIGFRDSTNSPLVGATRTRRGKFLNTPNSNPWAADRRIGIWDATKTTEDEFDPVLVKKHKVHPAMGLFMKDSVNESEPPQSHVSGWKPVKFTAPDGKVLHASRTIPRARGEKRAQDTERRLLLSESLKAFCQEVEVDMAEIQVDEATRAEVRREELRKRGIDPDQVTRRSPQNTRKKAAQAPVGTPAQPSIRESLRSAGKRKAAVEAAAKIAASQHTPAQSNVAAAEKGRPVSSEADISTFGHNLERILQAAAASDADEEAAEAAEASASPKKLPPSQASRPYDVIRDVFIESAPRETATVAQESAFVDTSALDFLASLAVDPPSPYIPPPPPTAPLAPPQMEGMLDPRLFGASHPHPSMNIAPPVGYSSPVEYPHSDLAPPDWSNERQRGPGPEPLARSSDFLRTALNSPAAVQPLSPAHPQGPLPGSQPLAVPAGRTPFTNTGTAPLPALRPVRSILNDSPPPPGAGENASRAPVNSNSGTYYGPGHARSYHTGHSMEGPDIPQMVQPSPLAMPAPAPASIPQIGPQPPPFAPFQSHMSPPSYTMAAPQLAPAPGPSPPVMSVMQPLPQGPQAPQVIAAPPVLILQPSTGPQATGGQRSRPGSSSSSAAQSAKYRKLEPAPTPPHRQGYGGGGNNGTELRTVQFDYREQIKDYTAVEAPPRTGPTQIRGWTHNNIKKMGRATGNTASSPSHSHSASSLTNNTSHANRGDAATDDPS